MSSIKLLIYGLFSEQGALLAVFTDQPLWQRLGLFLGGHLLASALFSLLLGIWFPQRFTASRRMLLTLFFSFNFFVPALGAIGTLLILLYFVRYYTDEERPEFGQVPLPPFLPESAAVGGGMGEGGAWSRLRLHNLPRGERLKALLSVGTLGGGNAGRLLQHATGDRDDEIRLLAFNLCERQEQKIQQAITTAMDELQAAETPEAKRSICRNLAFSYWEMVYSALAQHDLRDFFVDQAARYAAQAQEYGCVDPSLYTLLARIYLFRRDYLHAYESIEAALAAGGDRLKVVPYQAELAFYRRDFAAVRRLLQEDPAIRFKPGIGPVAQFWGGR